MTSGRLCYDNDQHDAAAGLYAAASRAIYGLRSRWKCLQSRPWKSDAQMQCPSPAAAARCRLNQGSAVAHQGRMAPVQFRSVVPQALRLPQAA